MHKNIYVNQNIIDQLSGLAEIYGTEDLAIAEAITRLFASHFPDQQPAANDDDAATGLRDTLLVVQPSTAVANNDPVAPPIVRVLGGQTYTKFHYGDFYIVKDQGKTRALEGPFCENILFPVVERFAEQGGEWRYYYDEQSGFLHGIATIDGQEIPESVTNGWYAMVLHLEHINPTFVSDLPHNPHPSAEDLSE